MMYQNRSESKTTFNSIPLVTRNYIYENNMAAKFFLNRTTDHHSNYTAFLPPISKQVDKFDSNSWRASTTQQIETPQSYTRVNQLPPIELNNIFTYFPKNKPYMHDESFMRYDTSLFDTRIFKKIKLHNFLSDTDNIKLIKVNGKEYQFDLGDNLILRSLKADDYERDYLKLLDQLTIVGDVTKDGFEERFFHMKSCLNTYYVLVVEDLSFHKIIASATLVIEQKFIRYASSRGRVEDVVVDAKYRGKKFGKLLIDFLVNISKLIDCYKVSLECKDEIKSFYEQFGFKIENGQNYLCKRY